uniref:Uncharacterized protein LOC114335950 n=1 Tax=Diabrotica virgifera virgifera TaxID=50390 RepID=A0A6P7FZR6_DIAVI
MRIYKSDGSYVEDNDTEFGWYFYEIMVDESNDRFEEINRETRYISKLKKPLSFTFESIDYTNFEEKEERPIEKISPDIEIESIFDVESCTTEEDEESTCEEVDLEFPPKDKLAELIDPCSPETKMLLSVISYSRLNFSISANYPLYLLGNSLPSISSNKSETLVDSNYLQVSNRANILSNLGLSDEDKSIQSICEETFEMHQELADIKKSFQEDVNKVNELLKQVSVLKNDLRETLYLNDIINLLEGDIEKVKLKKLPFRIFYQRIEVGDRDINLII